MTTTPKHVRKIAAGNVGPINRWLAPDAAFSILLALIVMMFLVAPPA